MRRARCLMDTYPRFLSSDPFPNTLHSRTLRPSNTPTYIIGLPLRLAARRSASRAPSTSRLPCVSAPIPCVFLALPSVHVSLSGRHIEHGIICRRSRSHVPFSSPVSRLLSFPFLSTASTFPFMSIPCHHPHAPLLDHRHLFAATRKGSLSLVYLALPPSRF
ncbi:hypothetical protein F5148DRAFT_384635 [Russula earlei]|uniref:Uncharacterized protein n=1 Tax=Russula earlei TaxID=71964 RepID=A0ACC0U155_9AGAM|nr:hypothetical protein F5148DRAFT_384635 [Russula earlei]